MKNFTVSVDDDRYHRARLKAVEKRTSVSALVRGFLSSLVEEESTFERLERKGQELRTRLFAEGGGLSASENLTRDALYDRHALR